MDWLLERSALCFRAGRRRHQLSAEVPLNQASLTDDATADLLVACGLCSAADPQPETLGATGGWHLATVPQQWRPGSLDPSQWVTYAHVYPGAGGRVVIQYWHLFAYNDQLVSRHGGDWDACIHVRLDEQHQLRGAWFSRHLDDHPGTFMPAPVMETAGFHPIVAVDEGGHAAYASPDDWLRHPGSPVRVPGAAIVWPGDAEDPTTLTQVAPPRYRRRHRPPGGTIWQTWTGGEVRQAGAVAHRLWPNPTTHGGLVNVGEYNPGGRQISSFLEGERRPLNGQQFIAYSGLWGTPHRVWHSPRGPVFQGYHEGLYRAWYNDAPSVKP